MLAIVLTITLMFNGHPSTTRHVGLERYSTTNHSCMEAAKRTAERLASLSKRKDTNITYGCEAQDVRPA